MSFFGSFTEDELVQWMRERGVRRVKLNWGALPATVVLDELELSDTIPAPPPFDELTSPDEVETKPDNICIAPGCGEKNGWRFAKEYCRAHGLGEAGVTGSR